MPKFIDLGAHQDKTFFALEALSMLNDIEDFIEFSENNIDWQRRRELRYAKNSSDHFEFDGPREAVQCQVQTIDGIRYRFEVILTQRIRYAALVSLITTIEWVLLSLAARTNTKAPKRPDETSEAVRYLTYFSQIASVGLSSEVQKIDTLIQVRNCIVHAAGLLDSYKYGPALRQRLKSYAGIRVSDIHTLGDTIEIEQNHLQCILENIKHWLPNLEHAMQTRGLLHK